MMGKIGGGRKRRGQRMMRGLDGIIDSVDVSSSKLRERVEREQSWGHTGRTERLNNSFSNTVLIFIFVITGKHLSIIFIEYFRCFLLDLSFLTNLKIRKLKEVIKIVLTFYKPT